jgi:integral membrane protein
VSVLALGQPPVSVEKLASAQGHIKRYRFMAFLTGVVLVSGCIALILQGAGVDHMKGVNAVLWIGHGWCYIAYVIVTFLLGVKLRWPLARIAVVMLAGTVPTASFVAEHYVTQAIRVAAEPQPVASRD